MIENKNYKDKKSLEKENKCLRCFLTTEKVMETNWRKINYPAKYWYDLFDAENKVILKHIKGKKRILEMGCGPGRIIKKILDFECPYEEIVGIDGDGKMVKEAKKRFKEFPNVKIKQKYVKDRLDFPDNYFDFCINAMNIVGWQEDEERWLEEMIRCSKAVFFSVYKKGQTEIEKRAKMYKTRGHRELEVNNGGHILLNCSVKPKKVASKAYDKEELEKICQKVSSNYKIIELTPLAYGCFIFKNNI